MLNLLKLWILFGLLNFTMDYLWIAYSKLGFSRGILVKFWIFGWVNENLGYAKRHLVTQISEIFSKGECSDLFSFTFSFPNSTKEVDFSDIFTFS